ncbi:unnamed protein product [Lasius platythorax]|uniref:Uncharacterized protein n=2 Tax=Lasius TaxID=488720 RepID=A0A0J7KC94_LASNI|nr:hypothetical protein RF55_12768 [Lasius niger]
MFTNTHGRQDCLTPNSQGFLCSRVAGIPTTPTPLFQLTPPRWLPDTHGPLAASTDQRPGQQDYSLRRQDYRHKAHTKTRSEEPLLNGQVL